MRIGTRSVLFGAHAFWLHPFFVFWGWWKLYGFPWDPRLYLAFFSHDLGYLGKPNLDGPEGEEHPTFGANLMGRLFGKEWHDLCLFHSRFFCKKMNAQPSKLCFADKMAIVLTPAWIYLPMVTLTGEIEEYMKLAKFNGLDGKYSNSRTWADKLRWYNDMRVYVDKWVKEHVDGRPDT